MPPEDEKALSSEQRKLITEWIDANLKEAIRKMQGEHTEAVIRRLNRNEYQYTMEDLLGLDMDYILGLSNDPLSPDGFLNNGKSLGISPLQIEHYLKTARKALGLILHEETSPNPLFPKSSGTRARSVAQAASFTSANPPTVWAGSITGMETSKDLRKPEGSPSG